MPSGKNVDPDVLRAHIRNAMASGVRDQDKLKAIAKKALGFSRGGTTCVRVLGEGRGKAHKPKPAEPTPAPTPKPPPIPTPAPSVDNVSAHLLLLAKHVGGFNRLYELIAEIKA